MPSIEVTESDLEKAHQQIVLLEDMVSDYKARSGDHSNTINDLMEDISEIRAEARNYDYLLNPRAAPEICTLCNGHPYVKMSTRPCPNCGCKLVNAQTADDVVHWKLPDSAVGKIMPVGEAPA